MNFYEANVEKTAGLIHSSGLIPVSNHIAIALETRPSSYK